MVTKPQIAQYLALQQSRRELQRKADAIEREEKIIRDQLLEFAKENDGSVTKGPYLLRILHKAGMPKWKDEFIKKCGAKAAEKVSAAAPMIESLEVVDTRASK